VFVVVVKITMSLSSQLCRWTADSGCLKLKLPRSGLPCYISLAYDFFCTFDSAVVEEQTVVMSMCIGVSRLWVCLSTRISQEPHVETFCAHIVWSVVLL